jgi:hypothetical protein
MWYCALAGGGTGYCHGGTCTADYCGNGIRFYNEECDYGETPPAWCINCLTQDFVVSDRPAFDADDGREETAVGDRAVATLGWRRFVVAWTQDQDTSPDYADVRLRIVDMDDGVPETEILVSPTAMPQEQPVVASLSGGSFAVAWQGYGSDPDGEDVDIYLAVYNPVGPPGGVASKIDGPAYTLLRSTRVNTTVGQAQLHPAIATPSSGDAIVVVWEDWSAGADGADFLSLSAIRMRQFDDDGTPAAGWTADRLVNSTTAGAQVEPTAAVLSTGEVLVAWTDQSQTWPDTSGSAIRARVYPAVGEPPDFDFVVNAGATEWEQYEPTATWIEFPTPGFAVAWTHMEDSGRLTVRANFVEEFGSVNGTYEMTVPQTYTDMQHSPSISPDPYSTWTTPLAVAWVDEPGSGSWLSDTDVTSVAGTRLYAGCWSGPCQLWFWTGFDAVFDTTTHDAQDNPSVSYGPQGELTAVWTDWSGMDGSGGLCEVRARYFPGPDAFPVR